MTHSLQELRDSLDRHAHDLTDHEVAARPAAVRRRVGEVRRRRRATAAGGLVLTLLVGAGVALGLRPDPAPVGPMALGRRAPLTMTSLDYTYRATGVVHTYTDRGSLRVEAEPQPRLVSWTTDGAGAVTFHLLDGRVLRSQAGPFGDFVYLPPGAAGRLAVAAPGHQVALVDYALTDAAPAGVTKDGVTFRQDVAGHQLLAAMIGDRGQTTLSTSYTSPAGGASVTLLVQDLPRGAWVHVLLNDDDRIMSRGEGTSAFDPGAGSRSTFRIGTLGSAVPVRLLVTDGARSLRPYPGDLSAVRIGVGIYDAQPRETLPGRGLDSQIIAEGHDWSVHEFDDSANTHGAPLSFDFETPTTEPRILGLSWVGGRQEVTGFRITLDGRSMRTDRFGGGSGSTSGFWVPAGVRHVGVERTGGAGQWSAVLYRADRP